MRSSNLSRFILAFYLVVLMLPIYWVINMSLKTNQDIVSGLTLYPHHVTFAKSLYILTDPTWVHGFQVSLTFVAINTLISVTVALPCDDVSMTLLPDQTCTCIPPAAKVGYSR